MSNLCVCDSFMLLNFQLKHSLTDAVVCLRSNNFVKVKLKAQIE